MIIQTVIATLFAIAVMSTAVWVFMHQRKIEKEYDDFVKKVKSMSGAALYEEIGKRYGFDFAKKVFMK
jgi:hypothetical protein